MKYFKESEFQCDGKPCFDKMDKNFLEMLDEARGYSSIQFKVTSSWRSEEHNKKVKGAKNSSHLYGLAVDISAKTSADKFIIITSALKAGFNRIGIAENFIHVDSDISKQKNIIWLY